MRVNEYVLLLLLRVVNASGCSNFAMDNDFLISVRTMDLGALPAVQWTIATKPQGSEGLRASRHGYAAFILALGPIKDESLIFGGMNDAGLSCDLQTLLGTEYPQHNSSMDNIGASQLCRWALEGYESIAELKVGLSKMNFVAPPVTEYIGAAHWVFRDANGKGVVVEFLEGQMKVYDDNNDAGKTGFGVMTNEPRFEWQLQAVRHLKWKQSLARPSVSMPGSWYPDERFERIYLVKSGMPTPKEYEEAMMQAVHVLNTITVPMGNQIGTDSGTGEGLGDHTQWGVIYDHKQKIMYWRSQANQNIQRIRLADAGISTGMKERYLAVESPRLPWYSDASGDLLYNPLQAVV